MQKASRPLSLGRTAGFPFSRRVAIFLLLATLLPFALLAASSPARAAGLSCTISASVKGYDANFSGTISGASAPSWTLHFGDGQSDTGSGTSVADSHTYAALGVYTVTLSATAQSFTGGPITGSCSTRVVIQTTFSESVQDGFAVSDQATYIPPLYVTDSLSILDKIGNIIPLAVTDPLSIGDSPLLTGPGHFGDSATVKDNVAVSLGSNNAMSTVVLATVSAVAVVGVAIAIWVIILPRVIGK